MKNLMVVFLFLCPFYFFSQNKEPKTNPNLSDKNIDNGMYRGLIRANYFYNELNYAPISRRPAKLAWVKIENNIITYIGRSNINTQNDNLINKLVFFSMPAVECYKIKGRKKCKSKFSAASKKSSSVILDYDIKILSDKKSS